MAETGSSNTATAAQVMFVGLGKMGWPMAGLLAGKGFSVQGRDANPDLTEKFNSQIAAEGGAAGFAPEDADIVITMLPTSAIVSKVLLEGSDALAPKLARGAVVVDMSSGVPASTIQISERLADFGLEMVDAPVSGGVARAEKGTLAIMTGGATETVERVRPVLEAMGSSIIHTGDIGSGHAMKALNNLVSAGGFLIGVEAMLIGAKFGLDPEKIVDVLNNSSGRSNSSETKFRQFVLSRSFSSGFSMDLMSKDLGIALGIAEDTQTAAPFSELCRSMWQAATHTLGTGLDHTEISRFTELLGGGKDRLVAQNVSTSAGE